MDERQRLIRKRSNLERRAVIYQLTRDFFRREGCLEVETPVRMPEIAPEQHIQPMMSDGWFLATSPELHMKRLLAAGYEKLFQFSRCFRKGESGSYHNPEFALLEWYRAGADYLKMLGDTERLVAGLAENLGPGSLIKYQGSQINLKTPWRRITVREAFLKSAGWDPTKVNDPMRFDADLVDKVIPSFGGEPTLLLEYPAWAASLARLKPGAPEIAERGEIFIGGLEIANAFSELRDAEEQTKRFRHEIELIKTHGRAAEMPGRFIEALPHLPECGGIALGVDRLVMLLCDAPGIADVIAFPDDAI